MVSPPEDLTFSAPICPECFTETHHDGDGWKCDGCDCSWDDAGSEGERYNEPDDTEDET
jgi:tRNA(Ile2) C34 agmatinyltransferase TiaS